MSNFDIIFTNEAITYLNNSLSIEKEVEVDVCVYLSVLYPYTKYAHANITFCKETDISCHDVNLALSTFSIYIEKNSLAFLQNAVIDFQNNNLVINAPNISFSKDSSAFDLKTEIKNLLENEINVILSQHGGFIELVDLNVDTLTIKFYGGCQGCGMVGYTLNNYIEKTIKKRFPAIKHINDITSHEIRDASYY